MISIFYYISISLIAIFTLTLTITSTLIDLNVSRLNVELRKLLNSFSIINSWKQFNKINSTELTPLYVLRMIILIWIIIVHTFIIVDFQYFRK